MHRRSRGQHGAIEIVEVIAVGRLRTSTVGSAIGAECSLQFIASTAVAYERRALRSIAVLNVINLAFRLRVAEGKSSVVEALQEQDNIGKSVVNGEDDLIDVSGTPLTRGLKVHTIVGIMPWRTPPAMLKKSPAIARTLA